MTCGRCSHWAIWAPYVYQHTTCPSSFKFGHNMLRYRRRLSSGVRALNTCSISCRQSHRADQAPLPSQMNPLLIVSRYHILPNPTNPEAKGSPQLSLCLSWPASRLISALLHSSICEMEAWKNGSGVRGRERHRADLYLFFLF